MSQASPLVPTAFRLLAAWLMALSGLACTGGIATGEELNGGARDVPPDTRDDPGPGRDEPPSTRDNPNGSTAAVATTVVDASSNQGAGQGGAPDGGSQ